MSSAVVWIVVALGLGVPTAAAPQRRHRARDRAGAPARGDRRGAGERRSPSSLRPARCSCARSLLGGLLLFVVRRTREARPVRADAGPLLRGALAIGVALAARAARARRSASAIAPPSAAVLALVAFGARHGRDAHGATVFQIVALVQIDNALARRRARSERRAPRH